MTIKQLLDGVSFEELMPYLVKSECYGCKLGWYKVHFDMLRMLTPLRHDDKESVCSLGLNENDGFHYMDFNPTLYDMPREHVLTMDINKDSDVNLPNAGLAAYFIKQTSHNRFDDLEIDDCISDREIKQIIKTIDSYGGYVPSFRHWSPAHRAIIAKQAKKYLVALKRAIHYRCNRSKSKKMFREATNDIYYQAIWLIGRFIIYAYSALEKPTHDMNIKLLCRLFYAERYNTPVYIRSYADETTTGADYIMELIDKYHILDAGGLDRANRSVLVFKTGRADYRLTSSEQKLCSKLTERYKYNDIIYSFDSSLGKQIEIAFINYESKENLLDNNCIFVEKPLLASTIKEYRASRIYERY